MLDALDLTARLVAILSSASNRGEYWMANYKAGKAIQALGEEFGQDVALYAPTSRAQINAGQALAVLDTLREGCAEVSSQMAALPAESTFEGFTITRRRRTPGKRKGD